MNRRIPQIGAAVVAVTVFLFALFLIVDFTFGSYSGIQALFLSGETKHAPQRAAAPPRKTPWTMRAKKAERR